MAYGAKKSNHVLILSFAIGLLLTAPFRTEAEPGEELRDLRLIEGDEVSNEVRSMKTEILVLKSEQAAIAQAQKLLKKHRGTPLEPEILFRLAELYMRQSKSARFFEIHRKSDTLVRVLPLEIKNANSRNTIAKAIATYELIQKKFPRFTGLDLVVFNNAFARQQIGQDRQAEKLYWSLIQNFKRSSLVPDAHLAIGEINFDRGNFTFALEHFNSIRKYPESRVYPYGLYKSAWSYYNLRQAGKGLEKLEEVVAYGKYVSDHKIDARLDLRKEALQDMTLFFEDVHSAGEAFGYFKKQAGEIEVGPIILKLAKLYERHGKFAERQVVLAEFIKRLPDDSYLAEVQSELVWNLDGLKKIKASVAELVRLNDLCKPNSRWLEVQVKSGQPEAPRACENLVRDSSLRLASKWIKIWKKEPGNREEFAEAAEKAFAIHLERPVATQEFIEARFAYAELLFQLKKYRESSSQYQMVAKSAKGDLKHDAAYAAILSLEKAVGDKWSDADEFLFRDLVKGYSASYPKGVYRLDLDFKVALIAYEKEHYDEAGPILKQLGQTYSDTEKGQRAQDLYLDILNIKKDFVALKAYSKTLLEMNQKGDRESQLKGIYEQAYFMGIQSFEEKGDFDEAIRGYRAFALENSRSSLAEKAWWNVVLIQVKQDDVLGGAESALAYVQKFPKAPNTIDAMMFAAQSFESVGELGRASDVLMELSRVDKKQEARWKSLAVDFMLLSGRVDQARVHLREMAQSKDPIVRSAALENLLGLEKDPTSKARLSILEQIMDSTPSERAFNARTDYAEALFKRGKLTDAFNEAKKVIGSRLSTATAKSKARLLQAQILDGEFRQQSVKARADRVGTVLGIKTEKLEKVQQAYTQAIKYGDPQVAVIALSQLAGAYSHFVESLKAMPVPSGLSSAEGTAFRDEITKLAVPLEEKVIETLQQGIGSAAKFNIKSAEVQAMKRELVRWNVPLADAGLVGRLEPQTLLPMVAGVAQ